MVNSTPPAGASGKNTSAIGNGSSNNQGPSLSGNVIDVNKMTLEEKKAENAARLARNAALQLRRDANETNVPQDEELLDLSPPRLDAVQYLSAFSMASPGTKKAVMDALNATSFPAKLPSNSSAPTPKKFFTKQREHPASSLSDRFGIHPALEELAKHGAHIPITAFTTNATNFLHKNSTSLRRITSYVDGKKSHLIDLSQLPEEASISVGSWHEAWQRYLVFMKKYADQEIYE